MYSVADTTVVQPPLEGPSISDALDGLRNARFYRPELDILRLGAFMLVFVGHTLVVPTTSFIANVLTTWIRDVATCGVPLFLFSVHIC
jgi:hypothetical protein